MSNKLKDIEYLDLVSGIKALQYKDKALDLLEMYADYQHKDKNNSIIKVLDDTCYRLKLAYFGRFV